MSFYSFNKKTLFLIVAPDRLEGKILRCAAGSFAPLIEEASITERELFFRGNGQLRGHAVDPGSFAFQLRKNSQWRFIYHAVALTIRPFAAPFLVPEHRNQPKRKKDFSQRSPIGQLRLRFDAMLVPILAHS